MAEIEATPPAHTVEAPRREWSRLSLWLAAVVPLLLLAAVIALIVRTDAGLGERTVPPIEELTVQTVRLPAPGQIELSIINNGPDPITIAQVQVDDAYWQYTMTPPGPLDRLQSATVSIPYPWVEGEAHAIALLSSTGVIFPAEVAVAVESPRLDQESVLRFALVGFYVGIVPIVLGLLWFPFLRRLSGQGMTFVLALTVGLLAFLVVDMWEEAHEVALAAASSLDPVVLIPLLALLTAALLTAISQTLRRRAPKSGGLALAYQLALGIGLHNLGEGLAIGAAFALGQAALGVFLIIGFTLHNVTEGIGIAMPIVRDRPRLWHFAGLAAVAGAPAIIGTWIGAFVYSPFWTTVFLAIGIGAILQVIVELGRLIWRGQEREAGPALSWTVLGGLTAGILVMYVTALLVAA